MAQILVLNGPNLNLLGTREPEIYGHETLADIAEDLQKSASDHGHNVDFFQSNAEHELIDRIHRAQADGTNWIIINPGAFTHTSIALRDALLGVQLPFIEVHLSNIHARETFRGHSYLSDVAEGIVMGLGSQGYALALEAVIRRVETA